MLTTTKMIMSPFLVLIGISTLFLSLSLSIFLFLFLLRPFLLLFLIRVSFLLVSVSLFKVLPLLFFTLFAIFFLDREWWLVHKHLKFNSVLDSVVTSRF